MHSFKEADEHIGFSKIATNQINWSSSASIQTSFEKFITQHQKPIGAEFLDKISKSHLTKSNETLLKQKLYKTLL